jgi:hypothetical protein
MNPVYDPQTVEKNAQEAWDESACLAMRIGPAKNFIA